MPKQKNEQKTSFLNKILNVIEKIGNKLPQPITLFLILAIAIILISGLTSWLGVSATTTLVDARTGEAVEKTYNAVSLVNNGGFSYMLTNAVSNFTSFAPLGVVLVCMLGVGLAESSGYISAILVKTADKTPKMLLTPMIIFLGIMSNVASDVGYVVLIPLGALLFIAFDRHPIAGIAAAFAGVSGGFSANLIIGALDPMLAAISTESAGIIDPNYVVSPTDNWFFMFVSTFLIMLIGTIITNKLIEPRLGKYTGGNLEKSLSLDDKQKKALRWANLSAFLYVLSIVIICIPQNSFLRNAQTGSLIKDAPLMDGIIVLIAILFALPGIIYGRLSGKYKGEKDITDALGESMATMGGYIALSFFAAQFISYFAYTNLGTILAINGAHALEASGLSGPLLMVLFVVLVSLINLIMGSASAKWTLLAPIFIPMFMLLGYSPALTQTAYRIGDSVTNMITPLMAYFGMVVVYMKKYDKDSGIGTLTATMLPYSIAFLIGWVLLLVIWMAFGLPLGPGTPMTF